MAEVRTLETDVTQYLDLTYKYLITRGELVKKVAKYPHVDDYRRSVQSLDEKQFVSMRFIALELRNHYVSPSPPQSLAPVFHNASSPSLLDKCSRYADEESREN